MKTRPSCERILIGMIILMLSSCAELRSFSNTEEPTQVILKLDDLWFEDGLVHPGWRQVIEFLNERKITGTIGLVCNSLEEGTVEYFEWINQRDSEGYEIWHHGYCHCKPTIGTEEKREFRGTGFDYQLAHLQKAQDLAFEKLGLTLQTFGAPYNSTDEYTAKALAQIPQLKVWIFKETDVPTDKFIIDRIPQVNIEYPVHVPDFRKFKTGYHQFRDRPLLVIQGHPRSWVDNPKRFQQFKKIIRYLESQKVEFTTPYTYFQKYSTQTKSY